MSGDNLTQKTQKKDPFTSLHKIKANLPHWAEFEILGNGASSSFSSFLCIYHFGGIYEPWGGGAYTNVYLSLCGCPQPEVCIADKSRSKETYILYSLMI